MKKKTRGNKTEERNVRETRNKKALEIRRDISFLLNSEEAKISGRGIISGAVILASLGVAAEALGHASWHNSSAPHVNYAPHYNVGITHTSAAPHSDAYPHVSVAPHNDFATPHTNTHASVNEAVTKGTLHNNAADGYGKHTANVGHNNNPNTHANTSAHTSNAPHYNYWAHSSAVPHYNAGHHGSVAPHYSLTPHHSSHGSHGSHGQW